MVLAVAPAVALEAVHSRSDLAQEAAQKAAQEVAPAVALETVHSRSDLAQEAAPEVDLIAVQLQQEVDQEVAHSRSDLAQEAAPEVDLIAVQLQLEVAQEVARSRSDPVRTVVSLLMSQEVDRPAVQEVALQAASASWSVISAGSSSALLSNCHVKVDDGSSFPIKATISNLQDFAQATVAIILKTQKVFEHFQPSEAMVGNL